MISKQTKRRRHAMGIERQAENVERRGYREKRRGDDYSAVYGWLKQQCKAIARRQGISK